MGTSLVPTGCYTLAVDNMLDSARLPSYSVVFTRIHN